MSHLPRCTVGKGESRCWTVGYTQSGDPVVEAVMSTLMSQNGLSSSDVLSFGSESESDNYLQQHPNTTQGVYQFVVDYGCDSVSSLKSVVDACYASSHNVSQVRGLKYVVQYNQTSIYNGYYEVDAYTGVYMPYVNAMERAIFSTFGAGLDYSFSISPFAHPALPRFNIVALVGPSVIFAAIMFNLVIQAGLIVAEKELKLRESMRVMGLIDGVYWFSWLVLNVFMNIVAAFLLIAAGHIFRLPLFVRNDFGTYGVLLVLFSIAMVPIGMLLAALVNRASTATTAGFAVFLVGTLIQSFASVLYQQSSGTAAATAFSFFPFVVFAKGLADLAAATTNDFQAGLRWKDRFHNDWWPLQKTFYFLIGDFFIYLLIALYIDNILYSKRPWYFLFTRAYWLGPKRRSSDEASRKKKMKKMHANASLAQSSSSSIYDVEDVDDDVEAEEKLVKSGDLPTSKVVILDRLSMTYSKNRYMCCGNVSFRAVKDVCVSLDDGQLFCLLGHNGAGKSTTIGMLTGLLKPTGGDATIFGHSILDSMDMIRENMGVCPQHDVLWPQLTAREHLELYAGFKKLYFEEMEKDVSERLEDVALTAAADTPCGAYSGGMKRRLSVSIALIGDPKIVFLDEPTTGMDPVSRRQVWNLIERVKRGRVTLLTTHSMEEADVLGDRIAIMKAGRLASLGTSLHLKMKYGTGYHVSIISKPSKQVALDHHVQHFFDSKLPSSSSLNNNNNNNNISNNNNNSERRAVSSEHHLEKNGNGNEKRLRNGNGNDKRLQNGKDQRVTPLESGKPGHPASSSSTSTTPSSSPTKHGTQPSHHHNKHDNEDDDDNNNNNNNKEEEDVHRREKEDYHPSSSSPETTSKKTKKKDMKEKEKMKKKNSQNTEVLIDSILASSSPTSSTTSSSIPHLENGYDPSSMAVTKIHQEGSISQYQVPLAYHDSLPDFFRSLDSDKRKLGISNVQLQMTTLEDVFLRVAEQGEAVEKKKVLTKEEKAKRRRSLLWKVFWAAWVFLLVSGTIVALVLGFYRPLLKDVPTAVRSGEPTTIVPSALVDLSVFPSAVQVTEVTTSSAYISAYITSSIAVTLKLVVGTPTLVWQSVSPITFGGVPSSSLLVDASGRAQVPLIGLSPDTVYNVWFEADVSGNRSEVSRFRTATEYGRGVRNVTIGATSSFGKSGSPYPSLECAARLNLDAFLLAGDLVFSMAGDSASTRLNAYNQLLMTDGFRALSKSTSLYPTWNDQEVHQGWRQNTSDAALQADIANALYALDKTFPHSAGPGALLQGKQVGEPISTRWRSFSWGENLELFILDLQYERNASQLISRSQMDWLKSGLSNSRAKFKLILSSIPFTDTSSLLIFLQNAWSTLTQAVAQRTEIVQHIVNNHIENVHFVSGGPQFGLVAHVESTPDAKNPPPWSAWNITESIVGPVGTYINPQVRFNPRIALASKQFQAIVDTQNTVVYNFDPGTLTVDVKYYDEKCLLAYSDTLALQFQPTAGRKRRAGSS